MRSLLISLYFIFFTCGPSWAASISIVPATKDQYEAETYIASEHLVTNLHLSHKEGKRPLLLILGGSNPGFTHAPGDWRIQAFLERGYHVLEAEYFLDIEIGRVGTVPDRLSRIRLESFWEQIELYLASDKTSPFIDQDLIGVMGTSKGGELALLLGSLYPQFKFVVGVVPSHVVFQASNKTLYHHSSWTYGGHEVAFVPFSNFSIATIWGVLTSIFCRPENVNFTWMHNQSLRNLPAVEQAIIKVENINGPILLVSGTRDQWWPFAEMSRKVIERLEENRFPHSFGHIECETDHFPYARKPEVWNDMLERIDKMVEERRTDSMTAE